MEPVFTNDAIILGLLLIVLALIFVTASSERPGWRKFYTYVPSLLLCYFLPALLNWPLGLIAPTWYDNSLLEALREGGHALPPAGASFDEVKAFLTVQGLDPTAYAEYARSSQLYFVASRYLLPASLVLLCLGIDFKGILNLGPKALIMFFAATLGIVIGGPIALLAANGLFPHLFDIEPDQLWRGLSTIAGSWIGGGANQTAMKIIYEVPDNLFASMIVVDVVVANIWLGFLLYGANISDRVDRWLKADNSAITALRQNIEDYQASIKRIPTTTDVFVILAVGFGATALGHFGADYIVEALKAVGDRLRAVGLTSLLSTFFWIIVIVTTVGLGLSFTRYRALEGVGASRWGSVFIYILVATIGMRMNLGEVFSNLGLFAIGIIWMIIHVSILLFVAWLIRAPLFFVAVGSQANVGGAASAPIVASAFSPVLAPVGVLMAVLGYALGTYGAIVCATLMQWVS
jgi:uncharacterized membrane protein